MVSMVPLTVNMWTCLRSPFIVIDLVTDDGTDIGTVTLSLN